MPVRSRFYCTFLLYCLWAACGHIILCLGCFRTDFMVAQSWKVKGSATPCRKHGRTQRDAVFAESHRIPNIRRRPIPLQRALDLSFHLISKLGPKSWDEKNVLFASLCLVNLDCPLFWTDPYFHFYSSFQVFLKFLLDLVGYAPNTAVFGRILRRT